MLDRTVLVTGDDWTPRYKPSPPPPWKNPARADGVWPTPWSQWADSPASTEGLHIMAAGLCDDGTANGANCQSNGGFLKARFIRVEKGGQVSVWRGHHSRWLAVGAGGVLSVGVKSSVRAAHAYAWHILRRMACLPKQKKFQTITAACPDRKVPDCHLCLPKQKRSRLSPPLALLVLLLLLRAEGLHWALPPALPQDG